MVGLRFGVVGLTTIFHAHIFIVYRNSYVRQITLINRKTADLDMRIRMYDFRKSYEM